MSKRYEIKFYVGVGRDKDDNPIYGHGEKIRECELVLARYFQGATIYDHSGIWAETHFSKVTSEAGITCIVVCEDDDLREIHVCAVKLREIFDQTCVLVTRAEVFTEFV